MSGNKTEKQQPINMKSVASEFFRAVRGKHSQQWLARKLGTGKAQVSKWETGQRAPSVDVLLRAQIFLPLPSVLECRLRRSQRPRLIAVGSNDNL